MIIEGMEKGRGFIREVLHLASDFVAKIEH